MIMICHSCGRENPEGANFCRFCGINLLSTIQPSAPSHQTAPQTNQESIFANAPPQTQVHIQQESSVTSAPIKVIKQKRSIFKKRIKPATQSVQENTKTDTPSKPKININIGSVMLLTFLTIELSPYLLRSIVLVLRQNTMPTPIYMLCGALGWCIAGSVLFLFSKKISGKLRLPYILSFLGLIAIYRQTEAILLPMTSQTFAAQTSIFYIAMVIIQLTADILLLIPLGMLFSDKIVVKQGGIIFSFVFVLIAMNLDTILNLIWSFAFSGVSSSFISTCAYRIIGSFLEAFFFTLAAKHLLKKQKPKDTSKKKHGNYIFGAVTATAALVLSIYLGIPNSITTCAAKDMEVYLTQGLLFLGTGDMVAAERAYEQAGEHFSAWKAIAQGNSYNVPSKFQDDNVLLYFSKLNDNTDNLRTFLATSYDDDTADMWLPLMLSRYSNKESLSDDEIEHRKELTAICIANEIFTVDYPTEEIINKKSDDILAMIGNDPEKEYARYKTLASVLSGFETCETSFSTGISQLIQCAEQNPDDISIQYITATLGSSNVWDGAGHFDGTSEAILRFRSLWFDEYGENATQEQIDSLELSCGNMLMDIHKYDAAANLLKKAVDSSQDSFKLKQMLASCYIQLDDAENSYNLAKEMYADYPEDVTTLWLYSVGSLKKGNNLEAIKIAGELADVVKNDKSEPELDGDVLLFTCVTYLSLNDSGSYTDYQYRIYNGDETDPKLLAEFKNNEFLYNYVNAVYWEKQKDKPDEALPYAKKALSYQENSGRLWYLNGMIHFDLKQYEDARDAYIKANTLVPGDSSTMFALANTYDALGNYQEAYDLCEEINEMYPNGVEHLVDLYGVSAHVGSLYNSLKSHINKGGS